MGILNHFRHEFLKLDPKLGASKLDKKTLAIMFAFCCFSSVFVHLSWKLVISGGSNEFEFNLVSRY